MADGPAPLVVVRGLVRSVDTASSTDRSTGEERVFGTRCNILTEPDGGFLPVLVGTRSLPTDAARKFEGQEVEWIISLSAWAGRNGGAGIQATYVAEVASSTKHAA